MTYEHRCLPANPGSKKSAQVKATPYGIHRAEMWLDMHGSAAVSMPMAEALASYAALLGKAAKEAAAQGDRLVRDLENMMAERNAYVAEIEAEREGRMDLRRRLGAREEETFPAFIERLAAERDAAVAEDARRSENRIVERVLDGVAEMICTGLEMSGQRQAARAIKDRK